MYRQSFSACCESRLSIAIRSMEDVLLDLEPMWNRMRFSAAAVLAERAREFYELDDLPKAQDTLHRARQIDNSNAKAKSSVKKDRGDPSARVAWSVSSSICLSSSANAESHVRCATRVARPAHDTIITSLNRERDQTVADLPRKK
jgi:hypothetical protein